MVSYLLGLCYHDKLILQNELPLKVTTEPSPKSLVYEVELDAKVIINGVEFDIYSGAKVTLFIGVVAALFKKIKMSSEVLLLVTLVVANCN